MDTDQPTLVRQVLAMTHEIHRAVMLADWDGVARLLDAREPYLLSIEETQTTDSLLMIREIQAINDAIIAESSRARDELQTEYRSAMEQLNGARQYNQAASTLRY